MFTRLWHILLLSQRSASKTPSSYWESEFVDPNTGEWFFTCHGENFDNEIPIPDIVAHYAEQGKNICQDQTLSKEYQKCIPCQAYCQQTRPLNECFNDETGELKIVDQNNKTRFCVFKFQMVRAKGDLRFQFPEKPNGPDDLCNPKEHACATIQRDCLHYNMTTDGVANCHVHPAYCAHASDDWLESHGIHGPDCARLSLQNFQNYLFDIDPWGDKKREYIERWLICVCNHPFRPKEGIAFSACKENIDNVFYQIENMTNYERCHLVNNATTLIGDDLTLCESQKNKETTILSQRTTLVGCVVVFGCVVAVAILVYRRFHAQSDGYGHPASQPTAFTAISNSTLPANTVTTPLLPGLLEQIPSSVVCYEGSIETKAIPLILEHFRKNKSLFTSQISTRDVLQGTVGTALDKFLARRRLEYEEVAAILKDISWWIHALHGYRRIAGESLGENSHWSIFHGAISPRCIAIYESEPGIANGAGDGKTLRSRNNVHAFVVNYELAQDILNHAGTVCVCTNEEKINIKYLPPEMIIGPERQETRGVLSADIYGFAGIAWKLLQNMSGNSLSNADPFDAEIAEREARGVRSPKADILKSIFADTAIRPSLAGLERHEELVKIIEECWTVQPVLRLTGAQLFSRLNQALTSDNQ